MGAAGQAEAIELGLPTLTTAQKNAIANGGDKFVAAQCATCHKPTLLVDNPIFSEPSQNPNYRDKVFPAGQSPTSRGLDPAHPITFNIRDDPPDNVIEVNGAVVARLGGSRRTRRAHDHPAVRRPEAPQHGSRPRREHRRQASGPRVDDGRALGRGLDRAVPARRPLDDSDRGHSRARRRRGWGALEFRSLSTTDKSDLIAFLNNLIPAKVSDE
jgi:hypothetical protein